MVNIFEVFLPQLLRYPNVQDPLNADAAHLMQREPAAYEAKVKGRFASLGYSSLMIRAEYVKRFATRSTNATQDKTKEKVDEGEGEEEEEEDHVMSDISLSDEEGNDDIGL